MSGYGAETYGERIAGVYDEWYAEYDPAMVDRLVELAGGGRVLELGIGTGRIALPLAERGLQVEGVDASPAMVRRLREKPGGAGIPVTYGDFRDVPVTGEFSLVYLIFNTFFALLTQDDQVACFRGVAEHLAPDGVFVLELFVPDLSRYRNRQVVAANRVEPDVLVIDVSQLDPVHQRINTQHLHVGSEGTRLYPVQIRYAYPPELDLMARLAGLELRERWAGWRKEPFSAESTRHVSVYGRGA